MIYFIFIYLRLGNNKESNYFPETKTQRILQNVQLHPVKYVSKMRRTKNINDNKLVKDIYHEIEITQENIKQFVDYIDMPLPNNDIITVQCDLSVCIHISQISIRFFLIHELKDYFMDIFIRYEMSYIILV